MACPGVGHGELAGAADGEDGWVVANALALVDILPGPKYGRDAMVEIVKCLHDRFHHWTQQPGFHALYKLACPVHAAQSMTDGPLGLMASLGSCRPAGWAHCWVLCRPSSLRSPKAPSPASLRHVTQN